MVLISGAGRPPHVVCWHDGSQNVVFFPAPANP